MAQPIVSNFNELSATDSIGWVGARLERPPIFNTDISAFDSPTRPVYVDCRIAPATGDVSSRTGATGSAFSTIKYAVQRVNAGTTVQGNTTATIILRTGAATEGQFRDSWAAVTSASKVLGIQAERNARPIIDGTDLLPTAEWAYKSSGASTGWQWSGTYTSPSATVAGFPPTDQVFVDRIPYELVLAKNPAPGQFYVDRTNHKLYIGEASGWDLSSHTIEVTMRDAVSGEATGQSKTGFFIRGCLIWRYGPSFPSGDYYATLRMVGQDQTLEYVTMAYASAQNFDATNADNLTVNQVISMNAGALCGHANAMTNSTWTKVRTRDANYYNGYATSGGSARTAGMKFANGSNNTWDQCIFHKHRYNNAFWLDVKNLNIAVTRTTVLDNSGVGLFSEIGGGGLLLCDIIASRNGQGVRLAGTTDVELCHATLVDNTVDLNVYEDSRTFTAGAGQVITGQLTGPGDLIHTKVYNTVLGATSRGTGAMFPSKNNHVTGAGASNKQQNPVLTHAQMFSQTPYGATTDPRGDDYMIFLRLDTSRAIMLLASPTGDFTTTAAEYGHQTTRTLAQEQGSGWHTNSHLIDDNGALVTKYFSAAASDDYTWKSLSAIPNTVVSTTGKTPSTRAQAVLVAGGGYTSGAAKFGANNAPLLVAAGTTNTAPTIALSAPTAASTVSGSSVTVTATGTDDHDLPITTVKLYVDGVYDSDFSYTSGTTYTATWNTTGYSNSSHVLTAHATDSGSLTTTSATLTVTVNNSVVNNPPVVAPTSPGVVSGTFQVSAVVTDDHGIAQVAYIFKDQDGNPVAFGPMT